MDIYGRWDDGDDDEEQALILLWYDFIFCLCGGRRKLRCVLGGRNNCFVEGVS